VEAPAAPPPPPCARPTPLRAARAAPGALWRVASAGPPLFDGTPLFDGNFL